MSVLKVDGRHTQSKKRILACARQIYLQQGLDAVSMRQVAKQAGLSATAIYRHFKDKEEMLQYMVADSFKVFDRYLEASYRPGDFEKNIEKGIEAYKRFALGQHRHYRLIFMMNNVTAFSNEPPAELLEYSSKTFEFLVSRVKDCTDAGLFKKQNPRELATRLWAYMHGLVSLYLMGQFRMNRKQFDSYFNQFIHDFLEGFRND